jgi:hypothetical protein
LDAGPIDAVLPLTSRDYERFEILRKSLGRFFIDLGTCWVVTPDKECDQIRSLVGEDPYRVVPESTVIPELRFYNFARERWGKRHAPTDGWNVQQLIKLAIADRIASPFYLTLDADVLCTKPVRASELILGGRAISHRYKGEIHREWYLWAERVLGLPRSGWTHGVTPALLSKEGMMRLQEYLSRRVNPALRLAAKPLPDRSALKAILASWRSFLLRHIPWTEYTLYNTFLEAEGLYDTYHAQWNGHVLCGNSVWHRDEFRSWEPNKSFDPNAPFFFSVIQSDTGVPAADVWEKVRPYLEGPRMHIGVRSAR